MRELDLQALEPRLLLDAAAAVTIAEGADSQGDQVKATGDGATLSGTEDSSFSLSSLSVTDSGNVDDEGNATDEYSLTLNLDQAAADAGAAFDDGGSSSTLTGTAEEITAQLANLVVTPGADYTDDITLSLSLTETTDGVVDPDRGSLDFVVTLTPVNDDPVFGDSGATVTEAGSFTFSIEALGLSDPDIVSGEQDTDQLIIEIDSLPSGGSLTFNGSPVAIGSSFDADQLGKLVYTHGGGDVAVGDNDSFAITVVDGAGGEASNTLNIELIPDNAAPTITGNPQQFEGENARLGLSYTDEESGHADAAENATVEITDLGNLADRGTLYLDFDEDGIADADEIISSPSSDAASFTADKLQYLSFAHDGDEPDVDDLPSFTLRVTDAGGGEGAGNELSSDRTVEISILENDDDPTLTPTTEVLDATGEAVLIDASALNAIDPDSTDDQLSYKIETLPSFGEIQILNGTDWVKLPVGGTFSQAQVTAGEVRYQQTLVDGTGGTADDFTFTLVDSEFKAFEEAGDAGTWGGTDSPTVGTLNFLIDNVAGGSGEQQQETIYAEKVNNTGVTVSESTSDPASSAVVITDAMLKYGAELDGYVLPATQIVYTVTNIPTNGTLFLDGQAISDFGSFTQEDIDNGLVTFLHDGSEGHESSFTFTLLPTDLDKDPATLDPITDVFTIDATPVNDAPVVGNSSVSLLEKTDTTDGIVRITNLVMSDVDGSLEDLVGEGESDDLWFQITSTELSGGSLEVWNGDSWEAASTDVWYSQAILTAQADGQSGGLRYVHGGGESVDSLNDSFTFIVRDDLAAPSDPFATNSSTPTDNGLDTSVVSNIGNVTIAVTPFNDAPLIPLTSDAADQTVVDALDQSSTSANNVLTLGEGESSVIDNSLLQAVDSDNTTRQSTFVIKSLPENGNLTLNGKILRVGSSFTQADIDNGLLEYVHDGGETRADDFTFTVSDGPLTTEVATFSIEITPLNDSPEIASTQPSDRLIPPSTALSALDLGNVFTIGDVDVLDPDSNLGIDAGETDGIKVSLSLKDAGGAVVPFTTAVLTALPSGTDSTVITDANTLVVEGTLEAVQASLETLSVQMVLDTLNGEADPDARWTLEAVVDDRLESGSPNGGPDNEGGEAIGDDFNTATASVELWASTENDAPVVTMPSDVSELTVTEDGGYQDIGTITVTDADSFDTDITVVLSVPNGTLQITDAGDVTVSNDGTDTITLVGTQEELATALANVQYQPDANDNGTVTLTVTATDTDLHGDSTALTTAATSDITITAVNDEPVLTSTTPVQTMDDGQPLTITGLSVADINDVGQEVFTDSQTVTVTVRGGATGETGGTLNMDAVGVTGNGTSEVTLTGTLSEINAALDDLVLTAAEVNADTSVILDVEFSDDGNGNLALANAFAISTAITVNVSGTNDAPTISAPTGTTTLVEDGSLSLSALGVTLDDSDDFGADNLTLTLSVDHGTFSNGTNTIILTGTVASLQASLDSEVYTPAADFYGEDTLSIVLNDAGNTGQGGAEEASRDITLTVTPVNDRPVADGTDESIVAVDEDTAADAIAGTDLYTLLVDQYDDATDDQADENGFTADSAATLLTYVAISGNTATSDQGTWQVFIDAEWVDIPSGLSDSSAMIVSADADIRFVLADDFNGVPGSLTVRLGDGSNTSIETSGSAGELKDLAGESNGNLGDQTGVWSDVQIAIGTSIIEANDAPTTRFDSVGLVSIDEDTPNPAGDTVANLMADNFDDDSADDQTDEAVSGGSEADDFAGVAIISNPSVASEGTWQYSTDTGGTWVDLPADVSADNALVLSPTDSLRFVSIENYHGEPTGLDYVVADDSSGAVTSGTRVDVSIFDQKGIWSDVASAATLTTTVNAINDAPVLTGSTAPQAFAISVAENDGAGTGSAEVALVSGASLSDVDTALVGDNFGGGTITVSIDAATDADVFSVDDSLDGFASATLVNGTLTVTLDSGTTAAQVSALIDSLTYQNTSDDPDTDTRAYTVVVNDGNNDGLAEIDGDSLASNTLTGYLKVVDNNDDPVAVADADSTDEGVALATADTTSLLDNDTDLDTPTADFTITQVNGNTGGVGTAVSGSDGGDFTVNADGTWSFDPGADFDGLTEGESAVTTITYQVSDGEGGVSTATVSVTVNGVDDIPTLTPDTGNVTEDTNVSADDELTTSGTLDAGTGGDTGEDKFSAETVTGTYGELTVDADGNWTYSADNTQSVIQQLNLGATLTDTLTVTNADGVTQTTVSITITGVNDAPVAVADTGTTAENADLSVAAAAGVLANDTDIDTGSTSTVSQVAGTTSGVGTAVAMTGGGTVAIAADGSYVFAPGTDFDDLAVGEAATTTVAYTVRDDNGAESSNTLTITVTGAQDAPEIAVEGADSAAESLTETDASLATSGTLSVSDLDTTDTVTASVTTVTADGDADTLDNADLLGMLSVDEGTLVDAASNDGTLSWSFDSSSVEGEAFDHLAAGESLVLTYTVEVEDSQGGTAQQDITITINGTNDAPVIALEDGDSDSAALTESDAPLSTSGTLSVSDLDTTDEVTPSVESVASTGDTNDLTNAELLSMLSVDADAIIDDASNDGTLTWEFDSSSVGGDAFDYLAVGETLELAYTVLVTDSEGATAEQVVTITITGSNDAPQLVAGEQPENQSGNDGEAITPFIVADAFTDIDNDADLTYSAANLPDGIEIDPTTGEISGTLSPDASIGGDNDDGIYTVTLTGTDENGATVTTTFTWTVANVAPQAFDNTAELDEGVAASDTSTTTGNVLSDGDTNGEVDVDGGNDTDTLIVSAVGAGANAGTDTTAGSAVTGTYGSVTIAEDGSYTYTLDNTNADVQALAVGESLNETFTYQISDGQGGFDTALLTITTNGTNDAPVIAIEGDDAATAALDESDIALSATGTLSVSDLDTSDTVTPSVTAVASSGDTNDLTNAELLAMLSVDADAIIDGASNDGTLNWAFDSSSADAEAFDYLGEGETLVLNYTVLVTDSEGATAEQVVTITITGSNDAPVLSADPDDQPEDQSNVDGEAITPFTVADAFTDIDTTATLTYSADVLPDGLSIDSATGEISGTLTSDASQGGVDGVYTITLTATDEFGADVSTTLTWTVANVDPVAENDAAFIDEGVASSDASDVTGNVLGATVAGANDEADSDGGNDDDALIVSGVAFGAVPAAFSSAGDSVSGNYGAVAILDDGSYTYSLDNTDEDVQALAVGQVLSETFTYQVSDGQGGFDTALLTVTINGTNDAPVIALDGDDSAEESLTETDDTLATSGTLSVSDLDTSDSVTPSVESVATTGDVDGLSDADLLGMLSVDADAIIDGVSNDGTLNWDFDSSSVAGEAFDHLAVGESLVLDYTVLVTDSQGATAEQVVSITINGTNDAPIIAIEGDDSVSAELTESDIPLNATGTLSVSDLDTSDEVTPSVASVVSTGDTNDLTDAELLDMLSVDADAIIDAASNDGTLTWTFDSSSAAGEAFDHLAVGETLELDYTVAVTDSQGATAEQVVTITITGTNDAPVLVADEQPADQSDNDGDTITPFFVADAFTDVDNDTVLSFSADNLPDGIAIDPTTGEISGTLSPDASIGGDNADGTYTVTLTATDENGATVTTTFTWTVANVAPEAYDNVADLEEGVATGDTSTTTGNVLTDAEPDTDTDGGNDSDALIVSGIGAGANAGTASAVDTDVTGTYGSITIAEDGSYTYTLDNTNADVQALAVGESLNETFTYQISDGQGGFDTALLTITINSTNDAPVIDIDADDSASASLTETDATLNASGTLSVSDVDTTDEVTPSVASVVSTGDTNGLSNAELLSMLSVDADAIIGDASTEGTLNWEFDSSSVAGEAFDYLAVGETLELDYTVVVTDSQGATAKQVVTITITGTNDAPVLVTDEQPAGQSDNDGDTITSFFVADAFTDVDNDAVLSFSADNLPDGIAIDPTSGEISGTLSPDASIGGDNDDGIYTVTLTATDENGAIVTTTFTWAVANVAPEAYDNVADLEEGIATGDSSTTTGNVLTDAEPDTDTDGGNDSDALIVSGIGAGANAGTASAVDTEVTGTYGSITVAEDGSYTYTLDNTNADVQALAVGESLNETFTYQISDGQGGFDTALISITINSSNDAPVIALEGDDSAAESLTETDDTLTTSGTMSVSDLDTTDDVTPSVTAVTATGDTDGLTNAELLGMLSVDADAIIDGVSNDGTLNWTFDSSSVAGEAFDYLAVGESLVLDYTVVVTDSQGVTAEQVVSITINGSNDAPVIALEGDDSAAESLTETDDTLTTSGTLSVSDLDTTDDVTPSVTAVTATGDTDGLTNAELLGMLSVDADAIIDGVSNDGTLNWTFDSSSVAGEAFDHLAVGESLVLDYTVVVTDSQGVTAEQVVSITINGSNDAPVIVLEGDDSASESLTETDDTLTTAGTLSVSDLDTTDDVTPSVTAVTATGDTDGLSNAELLGMLSVDADAIIANTENDGTLNWTFDSSSVAGEAFDHLAVGESLVLDYTVVVTDSQGVTAEQVVSITINGSNDAPVIALEGDDSASESLTETDDTLTTAGTLSVSDLDTTDDVTPSVTAVTATGDTDGLSNAELLGMLSVDADAIIANTENDGTLNWTFDSSSVEGEAFDHLAVGESLVLDYTVVVTDSQGVTAEQVVSITINGTNDAPVIAIEGDDSASESLTETDDTLSTAGTLSVSDLDTTDEVTPSVTAVTATGDTDGLTNAELLGMLSVDADAIIDGVSNEGTLNWTFDSSSVAGEAFDHLAVGESLVLDYTVVVTDSQGATAEQVVQITINGSNDAPVIALDGDDSASESLTETDDTLATSGTLSVSDLDTTDDITPSVTAVTATGDTDGLSNDQLLNMLSVDADAIIGGVSNDGTLNWTFDSSSVAGEAFDHLAVGDSLVLDYTVVVTDSQGATAEQVVSITINGSNDTPVIAIDGDDSATESLTETDATLTTAGTLSVSDLDTTDDVTPSVTAVTATGDTDGLSNAELLSMLSVDADAIIANTENDGTLNWTFDSSNVAGEAFDHLAVGESLVLDYTVVVTDSQGVTAEQVVSITINGSNDAPVIALEGDDSAAESLTETDDTLATSGTLSVSDLDTTDDVTPSVTAVTATGDTDGLSNDQLLNMLSVDADAIIDGVSNDGTLNWTFDSSSVAGEAFDHLAVGESLVLDYTVVVTDSQGATAEQVVSITINGSNDAPVIALEGDDSAAESLTETDDTLTTAGTLSVSDLDTTDDVTPSVTAVTAIGDTDGLTNAELLGMLSVDADAIIDGVSNDGTLNWTFDSSNVAGEAFDHLAVGESLVLDYTVVVTDSQGVTAEQVVSITINGSNDAPVIAIEGDDSASESLTETDDTLTTSGTLSVSDLDTTDDVTPSVTAVTATGDTDGLSNDQLLSMLSVDADAIIDGVSNDGTLNWTFDSSSAAGEAFDHLALGESLVLDYTVVVTDSQGVTAEQVVSITINGSNDAPVIAIEGDDSAAESLTETDDTLTTAGTLSVSDLDTTDEVTPSVTAVTATGDTDGLSNAELLGMLSVDADAIIANIENDGTLNWTFDSSSVAGEAFDHLAVGESLVLDYTVVVTDSQGATAEQVVQITINGSNDAPVIALEGDDSAAESLTKTDDTLTTAGTLSVSDLDTTDDVTPSVTAVTATGDTDGLTNAELLGMLSVDADAIIDGVSNDGTLNWTFDSASVEGEAFDHLAVGESLVLDYTVVVTDSQGATAEQVVQITINGSNDAPVLVEGAQPADQSGNDGDRITPFSVADAFTDIDNGAELSFSADNLPDGLVIDPTTGEISGTLSPDASTGGDNADCIYTVTLTGTDENGLDVTTTFTWTVANVAPEAFDNTAELDEGVATSDTSTTTGNVLSDGDTNGDVDVDGGNDTDTLTVSGIGAGANAGTDTAAGTPVAGTYGSVTIAEDGSYRYALDNANSQVQALAEGEVITETFTYEISDGQGGTDTALFTVTINGTNDAPRATLRAPVIEAGSDGEQIAPISLQEAFQDVDGGAQLSYTAENLPSGLVIDSVTGVISGTLADDASQFGNTTTDGRYSVTVTATDEQGQSADVTLSFFVVNLAPQAFDNAAELDEGVATTDTSTTTGNVLSDGDINGDVDVDGGNDTDTLIVSGIGAGANAGTDTPTGTPVTGIYGSVTIAEDGSYTYALDNGNAAVQALTEGEVITETFTYAISDGQGGTDTALLTVTINGTNDAPVLVDGAQPADQSANDGDTITPFTIAGAFTDVDEGAELTYSVDNLPDGLVIDPITGEISGTLSADASTGGVNNDGIYTVTLTGTDENGLVVTTTFTFEIGNPAPQALDQSADVSEDRETTAEGSLLVDADGEPVTVDGDGDSLLIASVNGKAVADSDTVIQGTYGQLIIAADGTWNYVLDNASDVVQSLDDGQQVTDDFSYVVSDGEGGTAVGELTIRVAGLSDNIVPEPVVMVAPVQGFSGNGSPAGGASAGSDEGEATFLPESDGELFQPLSDSTLVDIPSIQPVQLTIILRDVVANESVYEFALPAGAFESTNNEEIKVEATRTDGSPLPDYVAFDSDSLNFRVNRALALSLGVERVDVKVIGRDESGNEASTTFVIYLTPEQEEEESLEYYRNLANDGEEQPPAEGLQEDEAEPSTEITGTPAPDNGEDQASVPGAVPLSEMLKVAGRDGFSHDHADVLADLMALLSDDSEIS